MNFPGNIDINSVKKLPMKAVRKVGKGAQTLTEAIARQKVWSGVSTLPSGHAPESIVPGCMVLEGGSFRGNYTAGVLDVLMEHGINLEACVGTSAGALNGMNYVAGEIGRSARINLSYRHDPRYIGVGAAVQSSSFVGIRFIVEDLCRELPFDFDRFNRPDRRFAVTCCNCQTGKVHYFEKGRCSEMLKAVTASASLPYVSQMLYVEGQPYLDGGLDVKVPYRWAMDEGYEKIIVVRTRDALYRSAPESQQSRDNARRFYHNYPLLAEGICTQGEKYNAACDELDALNTQGRILQLNPSRPINLARFEGSYERIAEVYRLGREDTLKRLPQIREYLGI